MGDARTEQWTPSEMADCVFDLVQQVDTPLVNTEQEGFEPSGFFWNVTRLEGSQVVLNTSHGRFMVTVAKVGR